MIVYRLVALLAAVWPSLGLPAGETTVDVEEEAKYTGYKVLAVTPNTEQELAWLVQLKLNANINCTLDWWNEPSLPTVPVALAVNPACLDLVSGELQSQGLNYNITIPDLEHLITEERNYRFLSQLYRDPYDWSEDVYHNLEEINERVAWLVETYSEILSIKNLATTYEGRSIDVVIAREAGAVNKPVIWIDCGIHAREWVSPPTCLHAINQLVINQNSLDQEENLLAMYDFYILPVANPDGYAYSWTKDRMWRKNRRPVGTSQTQNYGWDRCDYGVDPNRNFPVAFNSPQGSSSNPCDDSYHGSKPFSEAESQAVRNGIRILQRKYGKKNIAAFVSIHAYSQLWMSPYGIYYFIPKTRKWEEREGV